MDENLAHAENAFGHSIKISKYKFKFQSLTLKFNNNLKIFKLNPKTPQTLTMRL